MIDGLLLGPTSLQRGSFPVPEPMAPILTMLHAMLAKLEQRKDKKTPENEALLPC